MNRNSSFYWASDSYREASNSSYNDDTDTLEEDDEPGLTLHDTNVPEEAPPSAVQAPTEQQPLLAVHTTSKQQQQSTDDCYHLPTTRCNNKSSQQQQSDPPTVVSYGSHPPPSNSRPKTQRRTLFAEPPPSPQNTTNAGFHIPMSPQVGKRKTVQRTVLRFQVVIWHVGNVDVCQGTVTMRFRITLFWNDSTRRTTTATSDPNNNTTGWTMQGRQRACRHDPTTHSIVEESIDVPPVSILNAVTFEVLGDPEVTNLDDSSGLFRWSCMYNATLFQGDHMRVDQFPHDAHNLKVKLGVLAHRTTRWDRSVYSLGLATADDSQGSTKIPHGLVVDHVTIPDFSYHPDDLDFQFIPLLFGQQHARDSYLQITLPVYRLSGLYDRTIMPILALLNFVAITCLPRNFASATASTETMLSIAFVQVAIRLTIDSHLPSVGYQIKMQRVMNECFWCICALVIESNVVFFLVTKMGWEIAVTDRVDLVAAILGVLYTAYILALYYDGHWMGACCAVSTATNKSR